MEHQEVNVLDLPLNALTEILERLPLKTLCAAKCVCKTFLNLMTSSPNNPDFTALHSTKAPHILIFHMYDDMAFATCSLEYLNFNSGERDFGPSLPLYTLDYFPIDSPPCSLDASHIEAFFSRLPDYSPDKISYTLVNSCNGLLFLVGRPWYMYSEYSLVCNPITNEYFTIIDANPGYAWSDDITQSMWLGFSPGSNKYKVLKLFMRSADAQSPAPPAGATLLDIGTNSWRIIEYTHSCYVNHWDECHAFLDGAMFWMSNRARALGAMNFFDFDGERFGVIYLPSDLTNACEGSGQAFVGVLGGCLSLSWVQVLPKKEVTIWMKRSGSTKSNLWSKKLLVCVPDCQLDIFEYWVKPLLVLRNGEILMVCDNYDLICYDPRNRGLRYVARVWNEMSSLVTLTPSFVSLKDALMVDNVIVNNKRWRETENPAFHVVPPDGGGL